MKATHPSPNRKHRRYCPSSPWAGYKQSTKSLTHIPFSWTANSHKLKLPPFVIFWESAHAWKPTYDVKLVISGILLPSYHYLAYIFVHYNFLRKAVTPCLDFTPSMVALILLPRPKWVMIFNITSLFSLKHYSTSENSRYKTRGHEITWGLDKKFPHKHFERIYW